MPQASEIRPKSLRSAGLTRLDELGRGAGENEKGREEDNKQGSMPEKAT